MEKRRHDSVFISYRRSTSRHLARLLFNDLRAHAFDPFLDVENIEAGLFGQIILREISGRAHFVFLVSLGSLQRCENPADWLRREFEEAVRSKRNIVPVYDEGTSPAALDPYLKGALRRLPAYNGINLYHEYFDAGMDKLRHWLEDPVVVLIEPRDEAQRSIVERTIDAAVAAGKPTEAEIQAEQAYNAAWRTSDPDDQIRLFTNAVAADPMYSAAYFERGNVHRRREALREALLDYDRAIELDASEADFFMARGRTRKQLGDADEAQSDFHAAERLYTRDIEGDPAEMLLYKARASARFHLGDIDGALADYEHMIVAPEGERRPLWDGEAGEYRQLPVAQGLWGRALLHFSRQDYRSVLGDCVRLIKIARTIPDFGPDFVGNAYYLRAVSRQKLGNRLTAINDLRKGAAAVPDEMGGEKLGFISVAAILAAPKLGKFLGTDEPDVFDVIERTYVDMIEDL